MGRKKRKVDGVTGDDSEPLGGSDDAQQQQQQQQQQLVQPGGNTDEDTGTDGGDDANEQEANVSSSHAAAKQAMAPAPAASGYAMTSHSGEIIQEDIYVSDGSEDEDDDVVCVLGGSKVGLMRRGLHHPSMLVQPSRQWVRQTEDVGTVTGTTTEPVDEATAAAQEEQRLKEQEEMLAKLDPAERAARLLQEKQRKLEEAKEAARRLESEENAGRNPSLFSKRTAFDIRFDQIDDKPWARSMGMGVADVSDYFNYGLSEEDWLEYAQKQLMIRQELTDASRQKRPPDPTIVPVLPRAPAVQNPRVAVVTASAAAAGALPTTNRSIALDDEGNPIVTDGDTLLTITGNDNPLGPAVGPERARVKFEDRPETTLPAEIGTPAKSDYLEDHDRMEPSVSLPKVNDVPVVIGGAWGAGAVPGSILARLIEEQEQQERLQNEEAMETEDTTVQPVPANTGTYGGESSHTNISFNNWSNSNNMAQRGDRGSEHTPSEAGLGDDETRSLDASQSGRDYGGRGQQQQPPRQPYYQREGYYGGRGGAGRQPAFVNAPPQIQQQYAPPPIQQQSHMGSAGNYPPFAQQSNYRGRGYGGRFNAAGRGMRGGGRGGYGQYQPQQSYQQQQTYQPPRDGGYGGMNEADPGRGGGDAFTRRRPREDPRWRPT